MSHTRSFFAIALAGVVALAALGAAAPAQARSDVVWSVGVGVPGVVIGASNAAPMYYAPPPVYYAPPAYYAPHPVYYAPPPRYYGPPPHWRHHHGKRGQHRSDGHGGGHHGGGRWR